MLQIHSRRRRVLRAAEGVASYSDGAAHLTRLPPGLFAHRRPGPRPRPRPRPRPPLSTTPHGTAVSYSVHIHLAAKPTATCVCFPISSTNVSDSQPAMTSQHTAHLSTPTRQIPTRFSSTLNSHPRQPLLYHKI